MTKRIDFSLQAKPEYRPGLLIQTSYSFRDPSLRRGRTPRHAAFRSRVPDTDSLLHPPTQAQT